MKTRVWGEETALRLLRTDRKMMLLLSNKKGAGAPQYRQRGLPRLVPVAAPARGGQGPTQGHGQHASELGHAAEETEVLTTSGGAGDIGVLRTQRMESCGPAFFFFFFYTYAEDKYQSIKRFTTTLQNGKQKHGQISRQLKNSTAKIYVGQFE